MINKDFTVGTKVKVIQSMEVPNSCVWDDDRGRISTPAKKKLLQRFFEGSQKITAEIVLGLNISKNNRNKKTRTTGQGKCRM